MRCYLLTFLYKYQFDEVIFRISRNNIEKYNLFNNMYLACEHPSNSIIFFTTLKKFMMFCL